MNNIQTIIIQLLNSVLKQKSVPDFKDENIQWEELYNEAVAHQIHGILYPVIKNIKSGNAPEPALLQKWYESVVLYGLTIERNLLKTQEVFRALKMNGIKAMALKGLTLRYYYPQPELRFMSDIDILVLESDMEAASRVLTELGYVGEDEPESKHVHFRQRNYFCIELHRNLVDKKYITTADAFENDVWLNADLSDIFHQNALELCPEDQVLYLCLHMACHIVYFGFGIRQLCDLVLFVDRNQEKMNWNYIMAKLEQYEIQKFALAVFEVCRRLFDMKIPNIMSNRLKNLQEKYVVSLINDIFDSGTFGFKTVERKAVNLKLKYPLNKEKSYSNEKYETVISFLFPPLYNIRQKYAYVRKFPLLLPVAWIHRLIYACFRKDYSLNMKKSLVLKSNLYKDRARLLNWLEL